MNQPASAQPDALLRRLGSLADETRLRLLCLLADHELGVVELCDVLQMPQSTVSRHLKVLADDGWVASRRQGTTNLYRMLPDELDPAASELWHLARDQSRGWATLQQDTLRLRRRLEQRQSQSQAFFAGAAGEWDRLREELYGSSFTRDAMLALLPSGWTVADLGCGTGVQSLELARFVHKVYAIDNSPAMLAAARSRVGHAGNVEVIEGDLTALPLPDASCDAALLVLVLAYVPDPAAVLTEMRRILKPAPNPDPSRDPSRDPATTNTSETAAISRGGGKAVIVDLLRHDRDDFRRQMGQVAPGFDPADLTRQLTEAGFVHPRCQPIPPEPDAKGPALLLATATR
jgi:ubiquinone/menaquinone biosynthesis C-methylase UbiE/DNA-binding transcriptional ArsR family regulator